MRCDQLTALTRRQIFRSKKDPNTSTIQAQLYHLKPTSDHSISVFGLWFCVECGELWGEGNATATALVRIRVLCPHTSRDHRDAWKMTRLMWSKSQKTNQVESSTTVRCRFQVSIMLCHDSQRKSNVAFARNAKRLKSLLWNS